jgi:hypothetical protein
MPYTVDPESVVFDGASGYTPPAPESVDFNAVTVPPAPIYDGPRINAWIYNGIYWIPTRVSAVLTVPPAP